MIKRCTRNQADDDGWFACAVALVAVASIKRPRPASHGVTVSLGGDSVRKTALGPVGPARYRPHIVIGDPGQRQAVVVGNEIQETYLGVEFTYLPSVIESGEQIPEDRALLLPEAGVSRGGSRSNFTLQEGGTVVAFGKRLSRQDP
jgi:hypothetical protein